MLRNVRRLVLRQRNVRRLVLIQRNVRRLVLRQRNVRRLVLRQRNVRRLVLRQRNVRRLVLRLRNVRRLVLRQSVVLSIPRKWDIHYGYELFAESSSQKYSFFDVLTSFLEIYGYTHMTLQKKIRIAT